MPPTLLPQQQVILAVFDAVDEPVAATDIAETLEIGLGAAAHHVRVLVQRGFLERAGEKLHHGARLTYYVISDAGRAERRRHRQ